jgi:hypothetical protein
MKSIACLACAMGLTAAAQDTGPRVPTDLSLLTNQSGAGVQAFAVLPQSGLRDAVNGRTGFDVGVHASVGLDNCDEIRPRIDYTRLDAGSFSGSSLSSTTTVQAVSLGVDYLAFVKTNRRGFYGAFGTSLAWWNVKNRFESSSRLTTLMVQAGPGFRFGDNLSVEADLEFGRFRQTVGTESAIKVGVFYLF